MSAREKTVFRDIDGILLLDKPAGLSSNQALQKARHIFRARKAGHTGSLDPLATGLLPICFGEATKIAGHLLGSRKFYAAQCRLGATTTTDDAEGEIVESRAIPNFDDATLELALRALRGRIAQTAPVYSALKQGGVPLYKRARRGEEVVAPTREVDVFRLDLVERAHDTLKLDIECGSGTYVRSLVRDLGEALGCGAHLTALRRQWVAPFTAPRMFTFADLAELASSADTLALDAILLPLEAGIGALPQLEVSAEEAVMLRQGRRFARSGLVAESLCCARTAEGRVVALVEIGANGEVKIRRGFN